jgi:hypothetical protein
MKELGFGTQIKLSHTAVLGNLAKKYVWWESQDWSYKHPLVLLSNIMNLCNWDDLCLLLKCVNENTLREVLKNAPPGYFSYRSWDYWHHKLNLTPVPNLPKRNFQ